MSLELSYNLRHLYTRKTTSLLTLAGVALVVLVYAATLMLAEGLRQTLAATGLPQNAIVIRNGAQNEIQSGIPRASANIILAEPEVLRLTNGSALASTDCLVIVSLKKRSDNQISNVNLRGVSKQALQVRQGIKLVAGRRPTPGTQEVMVGKAISRRFQNADVGQSIRLVGANWTVVGVFDAGNSAFSSEIWGDVDVLMPAFKRDHFSSLTFRLKDGVNLHALKARLEDDRRLSITMSREDEFYESQSRTLSKFILLIGQVVSMIFSLGAIIGAIITMYSAVSNRRHEIGILRALGFSARRIFFAFAAESTLLALAGGAAGLVLAAALNFLTISTTNFETFSDISFRLRMTPPILAESLLFSIIMGLIGGALPALQAARVKVVEALRMA